MTEHKKYPLYEMLTFYWKKKIWFILIPIICAILALVTSLVWPKEAEFVGESTIFTGSINLSELTNPDLIGAKYGQHFSSEVDIFVPSRSFVKSKIKNDDQEVIEKELQVYNDAVMKELLNHYQIRAEVTQESIDSLEERAKILNDSIENYQTLLIQTDNIAEIETYSTLIQTTENSLSENMISLKSMKNDLVFFEKPFLVSNEIRETPSFTKQWTVAGFILGVLLSILIITLWQYINRARKENLND